MAWGRRGLARVLAGVAAVFWGWLFFGVQDLLTVFVEGRAFAAHYLLESGWGLLFLVLVAVPLAALAWRPGRGVLVAQVALVGLAVVSGAAAARSAPHLVPGVGLLLTAAGTAAPSGVRVRSRPRSVDRTLLLLALAAVVPALAYAWRMATSSVDVEKTIGLDHYPVQAALGVAVVLLAVLLAIARDRPSAWVVALTLAVAVGWLGVESVVYPHRLGSLGTGVGWSAIVWAVALLVVGPRPALRAES